MFVRSRYQMGELLAELGLTGNGVEIGVDKGYYSDVMAKTSPLSKMYLVDMWKEYIWGTQEYMDKIYAKVVRHMKRYGSKVEIIRKDSREAYKDFPDGFFDFIYIDADHTYESAKLDIENWYPKCKVGGVFSGHDYLNCHNRNPARAFGVKKAVDEFALKVGKVAIEIPAEGVLKQSWYWIR